jgi:hypothetical protein
MNWGLGVINNIINWGRGAVTNTISWGASYLTSWSGKTNIVGTEGVIINNFNTRIVSNSGIYEANDCLTNQLIFLNSI